jgi:hypothetical protein
MPSDNSNIINFMKFDDLGLSTVKDSTAFKKIQFYSKSNPTSVFNFKSDFQNNFNKLSTLYESDINLNESYSYGMDRQHNYTSLLSTSPSFSTLVDLNSVTKYMSYNFNNFLPKNTSTTGLNRLDYSIFSTQSNSLSYEDIIYSYNKLIPSFSQKLQSLDFLFFLKSPNIHSVLSSENDSKQYSNIPKFMLNTKHSRKTL